MRSAVVVAALVACSAPDRVVVLTDEPEVVGPFLATIGDDRLSTEGSGLPITLSEDATLCAECFEVTSRGRGVDVVGGGTLGRLYGLTEALEAMGWRFHHPFDTHMPDAITLDEAALPEGVQAPEVAKRGLHLHTLHPIEGELDLWEGGDGSVERATQVIDWLVRQRGNYLQWVGVDDVQRSGSRLAAWREHTTTLNTAAHDRGLTTGLGIQLFGSGNLQSAWDLLDEVGTPEQQAAEMDDRLAGLAGVGFDTIDLSFGEFFAEEPAAFLASGALAFDRIQAAIPGATVTANIHVGGDLIVEWQGEQLPYYFLATKVERPIVPHVHTVMFYDLFEDAGGAYQLDDFAEHRAWIQGAIEDQRPGGYFPETAYWIAFDDSVPNYFPLYQQTRWTDLDQLRSFAADRGVPGLQDHLLFSSGWEWGYWQNDVAALRQSWRLTDAFEPLRHELSVYGEAGAALADAAEALAAEQHHALIEQRLTPFVASWDNVMEFGYAIGKVSQPKRVLPSELAALDETGKAAIRAEVLAPLDAHAAAVAQIAAQVDVSGVEDARALRELRDGVALYAVRAAFAADLLHAVIDGDPIDSTLLDQARAIVDRRHADLHDAVGARLLAPVDNATVYDFGYLYRAETLCFWRRELAATQNAVDGTDVPLPGCSLEIEGG